MNSVEAASEFGIGQRISEAARTGPLTREYAREIEAAFKRTGTTIVAADFDGFIVLVARGERAEKVRRTVERYGWASFNQGGPL